MQQQPPETQFIEDWLQNVNEPPTDLGSSKGSPLNMAGDGNANANPPIRIRLPGIATKLPPHVATIRRQLLADASHSIIPRALEGPLREFDPDGFDNVGPNMFDDAHPTMTREIEDLWNDVKDIIVEAERAYNLLKDENAWLELARQMLRVSGMGRPDDMVEIDMVQTQSISDELLSTLPDTVVPSAWKTDFALAFNPFHPDIKDVWNEARKRHPCVSLSHLTDEYTSTLVIGSGIEVRGPGGDGNEAALQLGVWSAAALEKLRSLTEESSSTADLKPCLGFVIIGYEWKLYICWKVVETGETLVVGPFALNTTSSLVGIFTLRKLLCRMRSYLILEYWPWYKSTILQPLCTG